MKKNICIHEQKQGGKVKEVNFWKHYFVHCALCRVKIGLDLDEIWGCNVYLPTEDEIKKNTSSTPKTFTIMKTTTAKGDNVNDVGGGMTHSDSDEENEITFDSLCVEDNESEKDRTRGKRGDEADATVVQEGVDESNRSRASSSTSLSHQIAAAAASAAGTVAAASYIPFGSSSGERSRQGCCEDGASSSASSPPSDYEFVSSPTASENADIDDTLAGSSSPLSETAAGGRGGADAFDDNIVLEDDDLDAEIARELES